MLAWAEFHGVGRREPNRALLRSRTAVEMRQQSVQTPDQSQTPQCLETPSETPDLSIQL